MKSAIQKKQFVLQMYLLYSGRASGEILKKIPAMQMENIDIEIQPIINQKAEAHEVSLLFRLPIFSTKGTLFKKVPQLIEMEDIQ